METVPDELNPNNFTDCQPANLDGLKNYYIKNNG